MQTHKHLLGDGIPVPYDERLAERVDQLLSAQGGVTARKMFGGLAFMIDGNMSVGIHGDGLMVRVGPEGYEDALECPHCKPMDITGRPMKGWVMVDAEGVAADTDLAAWVYLGVRLASSLPAK